VPACTDTVVAVVSRQQPLCTTSFVTGQVVSGAANKNSAPQHTGMLSCVFSAVVFAISLRSQLWLWLHAVRVLTCVPYCTQGLLSAPNPDDPLDNNAADHWKRNEADAVMKGSSLLLCAVTLC
jgi:hypothetical protein